MEHPPMNHFTSNCNYASAYFFRLVAYVIMALLTISYIVVNFNINQPWPIIEPFLPMFFTAVILLEGLTGYLLISQFVINRSWFVGTVSSAYFFTMTVALIQLLVFPGVFSSTGLLGAHPQSAAWIWVFWHGGFPFIILVALCFEYFTNTTTVSDKYIKSWTTLMVTLPISLGVAVGLFATWYTHLLPEIIRADNYNQLSGSLTGAMVWSITLFAVILMFFRIRSGQLIHLWLTVALFASFLDVSLTLLAGERYSIGWYAARIFSTVSAATLFTMFLWEIHRIYLLSERTNVDLYEKTIHDPLTGIFNRRYFEQNFTREISRANRHAETLSIMMLDIDHFKRLNDQYGHQAGDLCLIAVAKSIQVSLPRKTDILARYGGEEFIVLLSDTSELGAQTVAERIRSKVEALQLRYGQTQISVTLSIGVVLSQHNHDLATLVKCADAALYQAKEAGRNKIVIAPSEIV